MGYAISVALLLGVVGLGAEQLLARWAAPRRTAWCLVLLTSTLFPLLMVSHAKPVTAAADFVQPAGNAALAVPTATPQPRTVPVPMRARAPVAEPAINSAAVPADLPAVVPASAPLLLPVTQSSTWWKPPLPSDRSIFVLWIAASSLLLLYVCASSALLHYRASRWRRESMLGHEVVVSSDTGPAVLGAWRPRIVMPGWCLDEPEATRALILQHEQQHIAGRDPLLLWAAVLVVVALPWNLPLWWQLRRLRLAVELDCDARVLRAGAAAGPYGEVLLAVTRRTTDLRAVAIAMGRPMSALERRIRNLVRVSPRHASLRTAGSLLVAVAGVAAAGMIEAPGMPGMGADIGSQTESMVVTGSGGAAPAIGATPAMPDAPLAQQPAPSRPLQQVAAAPVAGATGLPSSPAASADLLACLDPDVLHGLLLPGGIQTLSVTNVPPPELATFKAPPQLSWVASGERSISTTFNGGSGKQNSVTAVYRSSLSPEAARTAAVGAAAAGGWKAQPPDNRFSGLDVFVSENTTVTGETYCREGAPLHVSANALDGVTYVMMSISRNLDATPGAINACDPAGPSARFFARPLSALDPYMPKLQMPRDPATGRQVMTRGGSGSNGEKRSANVSFTLKDSMANVAAHFAKQMVAQGWSAETNWSGLGTAGSIWTRRPDADTNLQARIQVTAFDGDRFTVVLNVLRMK